MWTSFSPHRTQPSCTTGLRKPWLAAFVACTIAANSLALAQPPAALKSKLAHDVRVSSFQNITPGATPLAEVEELLGPPRDPSAGSDVQALVYAVGPFPRVEFIAHGQIVGSVVIHLTKPTKPSEVVQQLGLTGFRSAAVEGPQGEQLGQVYPERGVVFSFAADDDHRVSQIMLTPISAESFVLRAERSVYEHERAHADLDYALELDRRNPKAHWLKSRVLAAALRYEDALKQVNTAILQDDTDPRFRLTRSALLFEMDQYESAIKDAQYVIDAPNSAPLVQALAQGQLGDLLAAGPQHDYSTAMQHHLAAIGGAAPFANSPNSAQRRIAVRLLVDAHLSVANDITRGDWSNKTKAVPKWLRNANELVANAADQEADYKALQFLVLRRALSSYVGMPGQIDPTELLEKTLHHGQQLIDDSADSIRQTELRWQLVQSLFDAVRIERNQNRTAAVLKYARQAIQLIDTMADAVPASPRAEYLIGRLHFYVGSAFAIDQEDHEQAVASYARALPYFQTKLPALHAADRGYHGQRFVSMGVSYWQTHARDRAISLTERGLEIMQQAHDEKALQPSALAVPFKNLAAMYRVLGRTSDARRLADRAAAAEIELESTRRR